MIVLRSKARANGIRGQQIIDFLLGSSEREYQRWWPGTHLHFRTRARSPQHIGDVMYFDELVGKRRVEMHAVVVEVVAGKRITWRLEMLIPLPVYLVLELEDDEAGVEVTHTVRAGFDGKGALLDPLLQLYFTRRFQRDLDAHVETEFPMLARLLA